MIYVAHPFGGDPANLARARRWYVWLVSRFPDVAFVANWILDCEELDDGDADTRERALLRDEAIAARCDGIALVGGKMTQGMGRELKVLWERGRAVYDLLELGDEPPSVLPDPIVAHTVSKALRDLGRWGGDGRAG